MCAEVAARCEAKRDERADQDIIATPRTRSHTHNKHRQPSVNNHSHLSRHIPFQKSGRRHNEVISGVVSFCFPNTPSYVLLVSIVPAVALPMVFIALLVACGSELSVISTVYLGEGAFFSFFIFSMSKKITLHNTLSHTS